ncbi:MAG: PAS domain-containing sensor histidine kinase [Kofleriaceae bacterium]
MQHDPDITGYLFEHARDIILVIDADDGTVIDANRAAEVAYGYSRDELLALKVFDLRPESSPAVTVQMRTADRDGILFEAEHLRRDGTGFPVEVSSRGDVMQGRRCLFSIIRDISERKRFEREREELLATTQRALTTRDDFLMIASHELRTPVTNVSLQLQNLTRSLDRPTTKHDQLRAFGDSALRELARLTALISTLIDAQVARGRLELELGDHDLSEIVREVTDRLRPRTELTCQFAIEVPSIRGRWDRMRLDQVITNLVLNAFKYGGGSPIRITAELSGPSIVHLDVIDRGIGIAPEHAARIFDKFERAVPSHHGGLGLGLFIARQIVEAHGGRIELESTLGAGSRFRVALPRVTQ